MLAKGRTTIERRGGRVFLGVRVACFAGRLADFERIDPDRLGDVLELGIAPRS